MLSIDLRMTPQVKRYTESKHSLNKVNVDGALLTLTIKEDLHTVNW